MQDQSAHRGKWLGCGARWLVGFAACALLASSARAETVQVTSLEGTARVAGNPLSLHARLAVEELLEVETDGRCTLLVDDRALVQICGRSRASFPRPGRASPRTIELTFGELSVVALSDPDDTLHVRTPVADISLVGIGTHVRVAAGSGETVVSTLENPLRVATRGGAIGVRVGVLRQLTLRAGEDPGEPRPISRAALARSTACPTGTSGFAAALRADRVMLAAGLPGVGARGSVGSPVASPVVSDLQEIVRSDFPSDGLPLEGVAGTPSSLVTELSKLGMDEEVCDPITCNPVYKVDPPGPCGVPPERGCIP